MGISIGMLIFGLFDGALAFSIVFCLLKARFKGKKIGKVLGTIFGTILFAIYIALFVFFNTPGTKFHPDFRTFVYVAPLVLSALLTVLVILSQPPKLQNADTIEDIIENNEDVN